MQNTPFRQILKTDSRHIVSDGMLDCAMRSDIPQNMIMKSGPTKGRIRIRSGWKRQTGKVRN